MAQPIELVKPSHLPSKMRMRFSLRWLIVGMAFLAIVMSHINTSLDVRHAHSTIARQQTEVKKLRTELGVFDVSDPELAHVLFLRQLDDERTSWRWRIYLPPNRDYRIRWIVDGIPSEGLGTEWEGQEFHVFRDRAMFTLDVFVRKAADGTWRCFLRYPFGQLERDLPADHPLVAPSTPVVLNIDPTGVDGVVATDMKQPLVLFRYRIIPQSEYEAAEQSGKIPAGEHPGIMIWFEPVK